MATEGTTNAKVDASAAKLDVAEALTAVAEHLTGGAETFKEYPVLIGAESAIGGVAPSTQDSPPPTKYPPNPMTMRTTARTRRRRLPARYPVGLNRTERARVRQAAPRTAEVAPLAGPALVPIGALASMPHVDHPSHRSRAVLHISLSLKPIVH